MKCLAQEFRADLDAQLAGDERSEFNLPRREAVATICRRYLEVLFPIYFLWSEREVPGTHACRHLIEIQTLLSNQICSAVRFECRRSSKQPPADLEHYAEEAHKTLFGQLPELARLLGARDCRASGTDVHCRSGGPGTTGDSFRSS